MPISRAVVVSALLFACGGRADPSAGARVPTSPARGNANRPEPAPARLGDNVIPQRYTIQLSVDPGAPSFTGKVSIDVSIAAPTRTIWLHAAELTIDDVSVAIGGHTVVPTTRNEGEMLALDLPEPVGPGATAIAISFQGKLADSDVHGLFRQKEADRWYAYTQFEAVAARRAFPCLDEPGWKVPFELTLIVPDDMVAASNTPIASEKDGPTEHMRTVTFAPTRPLPTYLLAFAVGPFDIVDGGLVGRNKVPMRFLVPRGRGEEARFAAEATGPLLTGLEDYFDSPYPYDKLDSVVIPHFFGAMENPGLITYDAPILLTRPADEGVNSRRVYASVAAHELAHQWFGDLVTLAWWNDIWLNESFASWLGNKIAGQYQPAWGQDVATVAELDEAMVADSLITARKIRQAIETDREIFSAFDDIAYLKGSSVIAMFESWIGEEAFRRGMRVYMARHAWKTATAADFLGALAEVSSPEVKSAFVTFLDQAGVPEVSVDLTCAPGKKPLLSLEQRRFLPTGSEGSADQSWMLPVCLRHSAGGKVSRQCTLLTGKTGQLTLDSARCPDWVMANAGAVGYYRVRYSAELSRHVFAAGNKLTTPERVLLVRDAAAMLDSGQVPVADLLALAAKLAGDANPHVVGGGAGIVGQIEPMVEPARQVSYERFVRKTFGKRARAMGWKPKQGESQATSDLRIQLLALVGATGNDAALGKQAIQLTDRWLRERSAVAPDLVESMLAVAGRHGDSRLHGRLLAAIDKETDTAIRSKMLGALTSFRDPALTQINLKLLLDPDMALGEMVAVLLGEMSIRENRQATYDFIKANFDAVSSKLPRMARRGLAGSAVPFCDDAHLADAEAFFAPRLESIDGGTKAMAKAVEQMKLCIARRATLEPAISAFLARY